MDCQPAARDSLRAVARACDDIPSVLDATVLAPAEGPRAEWSLEIVVEGDRLPSAVVAELGRAGCAVPDVTSNAAVAEAVVTA